MTTALCLRCGSTKFGALCPCRKCGIGPTDRIELDLLFCDHQLSVSTLEQFGSVIKAIRAVSDDPQVCFWTFIRFVSEHPSALLKADVSDEIAQDVDEVIKKAQFPAIRVEKRQRETSADAGSVIDFPESLFQLYCLRYPFKYLAHVEVMFADGAVLQLCSIMKMDDEVQLFCPRDKIAIDRKIVAVRPRAGCLGWFRRQPWIYDRGENDEQKTKNR